jgi:hypothetical protein
VRKLRLRSTYQTAHRRLSKLSKAEVLDWADEGGNQTARAINDYRRNYYDPLFLEMADEAVQTLVAAIDVLKERQAK